MIIYLILAGAVTNELFFFVKTNVFAKFNQTAIMSYSKNRYASLLSNLSILFQFLYRYYYYMCIVFKFIERWEEKEAKEVLQAGIEPATSGS